MPTPRSHGGAPLYPIPLTAPGYLGLNKQESASIMGIEYATVLDNAIIDDTGKIGARQGFLNITTNPTPIPDPIVQIFEFYQSTGTSGIISTTDNDIFIGTSVPTSIKGALSITDGNWQFINFQDTCIGLQQGQTPIQYAGGAFATIVGINASTLPTGGIGLSAFGRIWVTTDDNKAIRYCDILDETTWDDATPGFAGDSGTIDMTQIWPNGVDTITAMVVHNRQLVVFGKRQIVIFTDDAQETTIGLTPASMYVADTIESVGCIARDSIQSVRGDLWFLSAFGIQSLGRLIQEKSAPLSSVSKSIQDYLQSYVVQNANELHKLRSTYSPQNRFYLLSFPQSLSGARNTTFCFDTRGMTDRGSARVTTWGVGFSGLANSVNGNLYLAKEDALGLIGLYSGYYDSVVVGGTPTQNPYLLEYESGWLSSGEETETFIKILKRIRAIVYVPSATKITFKWWWDFSASFKSYGIDLKSGDAESEWSGVVTDTSGEWNDNFISGGESVIDNQSNWGGGITLVTAGVPASGSGQYLKIGLSGTVNGSRLGIQQISLAAKIGRIK